MKRDSFDTYAENYAKVIAEGARASGETYEYMVALRSRLFKNATANELNRISNPSILDFGCGTGCTIEKLAGLLPNSNLFGFDTSRESIFQAVSNNISGASFSFGENCPLPYHENTFDAIYSNGTFHHIVSNLRPLWMQELRRVLKKQGALVIFENNPFNPLMMQAMRRTPFDVDAEPICAGDLASLMVNKGMQPYAAHYYFFFPHVLKWLRCIEPLLQRVPIGAQYFIKARKDPA